MHKSNKSNNKSKQTSTCPLHIRTAATPYPLHSPPAINAKKCSSLSMPFSSCKQQQRETTGPDRKAIRKQTTITIEVNK
jgi:hypothetical protein